jgi:long-chain acyl-CoA synthetase
VTITSLAEIIRAQGGDKPDAPAIEFEGRTITFGDLDRRSNRLANALSSVGVGCGDRVAFLDRNGPEYFDVSFALAKLNAVMVAVNWRLAPAEIANIVNDAGAKILVVGLDFAQHIEGIEGRLATVSTIVAIGGHARWRDYEEFLEAHAAHDPGVQAQGSDVAFQFYTSGTTGTPKGVMLTNDNFFTGYVCAAESWRFDDRSVSLAVMPMFHLAGGGWAMLSLAFGCQTVLLRDIDPPRILEVIAEFGVTNALFVPAVIQRLLLTPGAADTNFETLRAIVYGASPITDTVLCNAMDMLGCEFIQVYGLTETTGAITQLDATDHDPHGRPDLLRSCGKPYPWVEVRVVDSGGVEVGDGEVGELLTRSRHNMLGYWANDDATREAIDEDGWFRTGDAGYRDTDGYLYLHDRVKDMIVSGGENIYPAEVENVLAKHPDVLDVAVFGIPDYKWGEAVKAVVVRRDDAAITEAALISFAREQLAGYKLPKSIDFTDELPRNPSGKLLKREIRAPYWKDANRQIG